MTNPSRDRYQFINLNMRKNLFVRRALVAALFGSVCVLMSLTSCGKNAQSKFNVETRDVSFWNKTRDVIHGKLIIEVPGAEKFTLIDTLIIIGANDPSGQLKVFSTNTCKSLGDYVKEGRARNEFIRGMMLTDQVYHDAYGHVIVPLADNSDVVKEVDITASMAQGHTVVKSVSTWLKFNKGVTILLDNDMNKRFEIVRNKFEYGEDKDDIPCVYSLKDTLGNVREYRIFNDMIDNVSSIFLAPYAGSFNKHPHRNLVAESFTYMEYLLFFDFDNDRRFAIHEKSATSFDGTFDSSVPRDNYIAFTDGAATDRYLLLLYWRGDHFQNVPDRQGPNELLVFDWDGNYIDGFKMDRTCASIEYDEQRHILYAMDVEERVYVYDMTGLIP